MSSYSVRDLLYIRSLISRSKDLRFLLRIIMYTMSMMLPIREIMSSTPITTGAATTLADEDGVSDGGDDRISEDEICDKVREGDRTSEDENSDEDEVSEGTINREREGIVDDWENDEDGARGGGDDWTSEDAICDKVREGDRTSGDENSDEDEVSEGTINREREGIVDDWENDEDGARDGRDDRTSEDEICDEGGVSDRGDDWTSEDEISDKDGVSDGDDWTSEDEICDKVREGDRTSEDENSDEDEVSEGTVKILEREGIVDDWENDKDEARDGGDNWTSEEEISDEDGVSDRGDDWISEDGICDKVREGDRISEDENSLEDEVSEGTVKL